MQYSIWQSAGKGLKLHGGFWGPGGTCFAQVLKPSKCTTSTSQNNGKKGDGKALARGTEGFGALVERASRKF